MKASAQQQETLLELSQIDMRIRRSQNQIADLISGQQLEEHRKSMLASSENLIAARNQLDDLRIELDRTVTDLQLVEDRIERDKQRVNQSTNPKDIQGIQHELTSLAKRKDALEDVELAILEKIENQEALVNSINKDRELFVSKISEIESELAVQLAKLKSGLALLGDERLRATNHLGSELAEQYEALQAKGIGAGRLVGSACPVCGILISGANLDEIRNLASDEVAFCPECGGILIRS